MDLAGLNRSMRRKAKALERNRDKKVQAVGVNVLRNVALTTPWLTGRARFNWQANLDSAPNSSLYANNFGGPAGASAAIGRGTPTIMKYQGDTNKSIHITNNLVYIQRLNEGHSKQAPAGYIQKAIRNGVAAVRGIRLLSK